MVKRLFNKIPFFRKIITGIVSKFEGGVWRSPTIRKLYKKYRNIEVGYGSYGGWMTELFEGPAIIGNYTSIGRNLRRICVNHHLDYTTTHPCAFNPVFGWVDKDDRERSCINIGNDVWIGDYVTILPSCHEIGNGAVIAAGAVVTKDVPPYEVWGGVPACCLKRRFSSELANKLEESKWWMIPENELKKYVDMFSDPEKFADYILNSTEKQPG